MKINGLFCQDCGDIIYSVAVHDFKRCSCGECYVDGGFDYFKYSLGNNTKVITIDGDVLLKFILGMDKKYGNRNIPEEYKDRYHGKFNINESSAMKFFNKLIDWRPDDE